MKPTEDIGWVVVNSDAPVERAVYAALVLNVCSE